MTDAAELYRNNLLQQTFDSSQRLANYLDKSAISEAISAAFARTPAREPDDTEPRIFNARLKGYINDTSYHAGERLRYLANSRVFDTVEIHARNGYVAVFDENEKFIPVTHALENNMDYFLIAVCLSSEERHRM